MTALAGLVPCALVGIRQTSRCPSPRDWWYLRIASSPAYSPCEPAFGSSETPQNPVISASQPSSCWKSCAIALRLFRRARRDAAAPKLRPGHRQHLAGRVQLHRAGAERDHRGGERKVLRLEPADVAQHLRLGVVRVEDRMREKRRSARERSPKRRIVHRTDGADLPRKIRSDAVHERRRTAAQIVGGFIQRDRRAVARRRARAD